MRKPYKAKSSRVFISLFLIITPILALAVYKTQKSQHPQHMGISHTQKASQTLIVNTFKKKASEGRWSITVQVENPFPKRVLDYTWTLDKGVTALNPEKLSGTVHFDPLDIFDTQTLELLASIQTPSLGTVVKIDFFTPGDNRRKVPKSGKFYVELSSDIPKVIRGKSNKATQSTKRNTFTFPLENSDKTKIYE